MEKIHNIQNDKILNREIVIGVLYKKNMNIYGDIGNVTILKKRLEDRGYKVIIKDIEIGTKEALNADIYFMGGGQDKDMEVVIKDLMEKREEIIKEVEKNKVFLLICGAYQLFGKEFVNGEGKSVKGLNILKITTKAVGDSLSQRNIGNILIEINKDILDDMSDLRGKLIKANTIVGFENHSGQTFFNDSNMQSLGNVIVGFGNNREDKVEGVKFKNVFGTYCHGPVLAKNPHLADYLISLAIKNKYKEIELKDLDDTLEWLAHDSMKARLLSK